MPTFNVVVDNDVVDELAVVELRVDISVVVVVFLFSLCGARVTTMGTTIIQINRRLKRVTVIFWFLFISDKSL